MPATVVVGQVGTAGPPSYQEWSGPSGTGNSLPPAGPLSFSSDNTAVATIDPVSGQYTPLSDGVANITTSDATNGLSATDALTVTSAPPPPAQSATLNLALGVGPVPAQVAKGAGWKRR